MFVHNVNTQRAQSLLTDMAAIGAELPPGVATALAEYKQHQQNLAELSERASSDNYVETVTKVLGGAMPPTKDVLLLLLADLLSKRNVDASVIRSALDSKIYQAFIDHAAELVEAVRTVFDADVHKAVEAHRVLGDVALDDFPAIARRGGTAAAAWQEATAAEDMAHKVLGIVIRMSQLGAYPEIGQWVPLVTADLELKQYQALSNRNGGLWLLVRSGHTPSLASASEFERRREEVESAWRTSAQRARTVRSGQTVAGSSVYDQ